MSISIDTRTSKLKTLCKIKLCTKMFCKIKTQANMPKKRMSKYFHTISINEPHIISQTIRFFINQYLFSLLNDFKIRNIQFFYHFPILRTHIRHKIIHL